MTPKKQAISAAERKPKSRMNRLKTMSEDEEMDFKEKERERVGKSTQNKRKKEQEQMTLMNWGILKTVKLQGSKP